ncbi:hypothetical protein [Rufibacter roseus]|nr:hypothetical protein [Rufibacter roseus]
MTSRFLSLLCAVALMGCAAGGSTSSSNTGAGSTDTNVNAKGGTATTLTNIEQYRPTFPAAPSASAPAAAPVAPTRHIRNEVTVLMDSVAQVQKNIRYASGYRILAYTGIERKAAMDLRNAIIQRLPEEKDYLTYKQPTYQLKIGDFFTRVEAQAALSKIQDLLPRAMLVQETINIPK